LLVAICDSHRTAFLTSDRPLQSARAQAPVGRLAPYELLQNFTPLTPTTYRSTDVLDKQAALQVLQLIAPLTRLQLQTQRSSAHVVPRLLQAIMWQEFWLTPSL